jgi:hypothetical protein
LKPKDQQNLVIALLKAYVVKVWGHCNPRVHDRLRNFCLLIHASSPKAYDKIAGNINLLSKRSINVKMQNGLLLLWSTILVMNSRI